MPVATSISSEISIESSSLFIFCRKDGNDFEADTVSGFQSTPELKRDKTYSAFSFDRITFFNMVNFVYTFLETHGYVLLFS